jgi:hypothetical protein
MPYLVLHFFDLLIMLTIMCFMLWYDFLLEVQNICDCACQKCMIYIILCYKLNNCARDGSQHGKQFISYSSPCLVLYCVLSLLLTSMKTDTVEQAKVFFKFVYMFYLIRYIFDELVWN